MFYNSKYVKEKICIQLDMTRKDARLLSMFLQSACYTYLDEITTDPNIVTGDTKIALEHAVSLALELSLKLDKVVS
jgi:hypothetical protein